MSDKATVRIKCSSIWIVVQHGTLLPLVLMTGKTFFLKKAEPLWTSFHTISLQFRLLRQSLLVTRRLPASSILELYSKQKSSGSKSVTIFCVCNRIKWSHRKKSRFLSYAKSSKKKNMCMWYTSCFNMKKREAERLNIRGWLANML